MVEAAGIRKAESCFEGSGWVNAQSSKDSELLKLVYWFTYFYSLYSVTTSLLSSVLAPMFNFFYKLLGACIQAFDVPIASNLC